MFANLMPVFGSHITFERSPEGDYPLGYSYSRENNPNRQALEECLAALEGGRQAICLASGLAVGCALVWTFWRQRRAKL